MSKHLDLHVVHEDRQLVALAGKTAVGKPAAHGQGRRAGRLLRRPAVAGAMGHEPIDQFL